MIILSKYYQKPVFKICKIIFSSSGEVHIKKMFTSSETIILGLYINGDFSPFQPRLGNYFRLRGVYSWLAFPYFNLSPSQICYLYRPRGHSVTGTKTYQQSLYRKTLTYSVDLVENFFQSPSKKI